MFTYFYAEKQKQNTEEAAEKNMYRNRERKMKKENSEKFQKCENIVSKITATAKR